MSAPDVREQAAWLGVAAAVGAAGSGLFVLRAARGDRVVLVMLALLGLAGTATAVVVEAEQVSEAARHP